MDRIRNTDVYYKKGVHIMIFFTESEYYDWFITSVLIRHIFIAQENLKSGDFMCL